MFMPEIEPYQLLLSDFHVSSPQELSFFCIKEKHNLRESFQVQSHRIAHYFQHHVWISENSIINWARSHTSVSLQSFFPESTPIGKKIYRLEKNLLLPESSLIRKCRNAVKFFFEFIRHPSTVGAIAPSSDSLAKKIVRYIEKNPLSPPRRILEVGPGSGSFTRKIIKRLNPNDTLILVEYDPKFCIGLQKEFGSIPNVTIINQSILDFQAEEGFDTIVSGVPHNSLSANMVKSMFEKYVALTKHSGTISYFDYPFLPSLKKPFLTDEQQTDFEEILRQKEILFQQCGIAKDIVFGNVPPARVSHHRKQ